MSDVPPPPPPPGGAEPRADGPPPPPGAPAQPSAETAPSPTVPPPGAPHAPSPGTAPQDAPDAGPPPTSSGRFPAEVATVVLDDRERPLDPKIVPFWRLSTASSVLMPGTIATVLLGGFFGRTAALTAVTVVAVLAVTLTWWYPPAKYARWRWRLTDLAVELHHGVLVRTTETLPYFRIQQIDVNQGPIDRLLDLASLQVTSASASGSVVLPGIAVGDAPAIRRALLERAAEAAAGDDGDGVRDAV